MCFGMSPTSSTQTSNNSNANQTATSNNTGTTNTGTTNIGQTSATANPAVANAAIGNLGFVNNLQASGFQPYTGQQVAQLSPGQQQTIGNANTIANNGTGNMAASMIGGYANAPAQSVNPQQIYQNMSPYMNQYVMQALAPQLRQMDLSNAATNNATNATATGSGAFGDARTGIEQSNNAFNQNVAREGLIGNAYNNAFNTAIGAGAQDTANNLTGQTTNANLAEQALGRSLGGAQALQGLQTQQLGTQGTANQLNQQNTANQQAQLTAQYNQWLMAQQYPFQTAQLTNSTIGTAAGAMPASTNTSQVGTGTGTQTQVGNTTGTSTSTGSGTSTTEQPNNSGLALLGTLGGALLGGPVGASIGGSMFGGGGGGVPGAVGPTSVGGAPVSGGTFLGNLFSDIRLKEDIDEVGELHDGTPVYSFRYKADPLKRKQIGLMAQDVEKRRPDAVQEVEGFKTVNYAKATALARAMSAAI